MRVLRQMSVVLVFSLASSGALRTKEGAQTIITPLLFTTDQTQIIESKAVKGQIPDIMGLLEKFKPSGEIYTLAARINGETVSAFPNGAPKPPSETDEDEIATAKPIGSSTDATATEDVSSNSKPLDNVATTGVKPHISKSAEPINVIIFADSDMLEDRFWATEQEFFGERIVFPHANNGDLVVNALDNLSGSNDLVGLRSRGTAYRPFSLIADLQTAAEQRFRAEEQRLQKKVSETQEKLGALATGKQPEAATAEVILSEEQQAEIDKFRLELVETRGELRDVQLALREDIETLQGALRFANIAMIPILVTLFATGLGGVRAWRRRRRRIR